MSNDEDLAAEIAEFLNSEFGGDLTNLQNADKVLRDIEKTEEEISSKLPPSTDDATQYVTFHKNAKEALQNVSRFQQKHDTLQKSAQSEIENLKPIRDNFSSHLSTISQLEKSFNYLQWISFIEYKSDQIGESVKQGISSDMTLHFSSFKEIWSKSRNSSCKNFIAYAENIMLYWHNVLKERFENEFNKVLSSLHWPLLLTAAPSSLKTSPDYISKFNYLFKTLYDIQLPDGFKLPAESSCPLEQTFLLPLQMMFEPLRKRFLFHFMSKKQTNRIDKPEWYLAQILTWISDHTPFLNDVVQPLIDQKELSVLAIDELMRFLVQLAISRLKKDLPVLLVEEVLLSHTIDEIFLFEHELRNQDYPAFFPSILEVLLTEPCFSRWKSLEHKSALDKMDRLLNSETAWKPCYQDEDDLDDLCIPECAETFITLLLTMTERYKHLPGEKHQLCFMTLQLELLDDFRLRLHQLSQYQVEEALNPKYCAIINALNYVIMVLNEWSNFPFFLKLYAYVQKRRKSDSLAESKSRRQPKGAESEEEHVDGSVFDEELRLLEHMKKDLLSSLCERVMLDIKAKSRPYRKEKWFCMAAPHDRKSFEVSPLAYPLLDVITSSLQGLNDLLAKPLFTNVWQQIAHELNEYLYEEVILQNSFNERGAEQLNFDMTRNLFPIFGMYTLKPENYFKLVKESCVLLTLSPAPSMLLKETLKQTESMEDQCNALAELGVHTLKPSHALVILSQRNDISS